MNDETRFVWCDMADDTTWTRVYDGTHFCAMCGDTGHKEIDIVPAVFPDTKTT